VSIFVEISALYLNSFVFLVSVAAAKVVEM